MQGSERVKIRNLSLKTCDVSISSENAEISAEKRLIKQLLRNYEHVGVVGRPVINTWETINVSYGIGLIQIIDLDEKNQILTTNVWCRYVSTLSTVFSVNACVEASIT